MTKFGYIHTEETKRKMSIARRKNPSSFMLGKHHSEETKEKIGKAHRGENSVHWKGGKQINHAGYILIKKHNHPHAHKKHKYIFEHRLVMEKHLGRYLNPTERVHHINGVKTDNRIENLKLFDNESGHQKNSPNHPNRLNGKWSHKYDQCIKCKSTKRPHHTRGLCNKCRQQKII